MFRLRKKQKQRRETYIRNFVFGVEDSLVSTVGLLSGIAAAGVTKKEIVLTGAVLIFVEAFSMGIGSLLSEHSVEEYEMKKPLPLSQSLFGAGVMFLSYLFSGFIPILPYILLPSEQAFWVSILLTLVSLFILGTTSARLSKTSLVREGAEMLVIGGAAAFIGIAVGIFMKTI